MLSHAEFVYNQSKNRTTQKSPLEIVYGMNFTNVVNLIPVPNVGQIGVAVTDLAAHISSIH